MLIIAVSDVHIGYEKSNKDDFNKFTDEILVKLGSNDHLVLLGDIVDFWRAKNVNIISQNEKLLNKINNLQSQTNVYYVIGNHDYTILNLMNMLNDRFPFKVFKNLVLSEGEVNYYFTHGYQLEAFNLEPLTLKDYELLCEGLCDRTEDFLGSFLSNLWGSLKMDFKLEANEMNEILSLTEPPENRGSIDNIRKQAESQFFKNFFLGCKKDEFLIFGHTHKPFIDKENKVANTGSWVNSTEEFNTYITISNKDIQQIRYK